MDFLEKRKFSWPYWDSNPRLSSPDATLVTLLKSILKRETCRTAK